MVLQEMREGRLVVAMPHAMDQRGRVFVGQKLIVKIQQNGMAESVFARHADSNVTDCPTLNSGICAEKPICKCPHFRSESANILSV